MGPSLYHIFSGMALRRGSASGIVGVWGLAGSDFESEAVDWESLEANGGSAPASEEPEIWYDDGLVLSIRRSWYLRRKMRHNNTQAAGTRNFVPRLAGIIDASSNVYPTSQP